jgi:hypothetical protein
MILSGPNKKHFIFIHVYKTGGGSIAHTLMPFATDRNLWSGPTKCHLSAKELEKQVPDFKDYFTFAFVRNPWERYASAYFYQTSNNEKRGNLDRFQGTFEEFLHHNHTTPMRFSQTDFICDDDFNIMVDYVGRFEHLQEDYDYLLNKMGVVNRPLPSINKTKHKHYSHYYNDRMVEYVRVKCAPEIALFGYEFERKSDADM